MNDVYTAEDYATDIDAVLRTIADFVEAHEKHPEVTRKMWAELVYGGDILYSLVFRGARE